MQMPVFRLLYALYCAVWTFSTELSVCECLLNQDNTSDTIFQFAP